MDAHEVARWRRHPDNSGHHAHANPCLIRNTTEIFTRVNECLCVKLACIEAVQIRERP
jgi:hypothetical protein